MALTRTTTTSTQRDAGSSRRTWIRTLCFGFVSLVYFADIFLKASAKCFWFDELYTVYLCRLPDFKSTWAAVAHGVDFNPPLFYLLERGAHRLFGEGLIATRLPAMVGVWLFCVCLFLFVARRAGPLAGFVAGVFPFFTLIQYYAYEARPHGIVLGWCGLALVCWQRAKDGRRRYWWLVGFSLSLAGALMTHVYAVQLLFPFAAVEFYALLKNRRPDWGMATAIVLPFVLAVAVYLPLFRSYRTVMPATYFLASHDMLERFLMNAVGPGMWILLLALGLFAFGVREQPAAPVIPGRGIPRREVLITIAFAIIPLLGLVGAKFTHGPLFDRYFLSSIAGYAICLGLASSRLKVGSWVGSWTVAGVLAGCMLLMLLGDLGATFYFWSNHSIMLFEPSTGIRISTNAKNPMDLNASLMAPEKGLDIVVPYSLDYLYFLYYAPPEVASRLYYAAPKGDPGAGRFAKWAHVNARTLTFDQLFATHKRFLVYSSRGSTITRYSMQAFVNAGYTLRSVRTDLDGTLYEYEK